ncbi:Clp protease N-terminal domain-containing protein [Streptomyces sp. NPDC021212]|uniref:Clp protease N-terminal domain-containing protein n=1 Tax=Streptomyces sp. NPDC021212 TaxID=3365118 RepID=UPI0037B343AD
MSSASRPGRPHDAREAGRGAARRAEEAGSTRIDCDHLLLGLARIGRGVAAAILGEPGAAPAALGGDGGTDPAEA